MIHFLCNWSLEIQFQNFEPETFRDITAILQNVMILEKIWGNFEHHWKLRNCFLKLSSSVENEPWQSCLDIGSEVTVLGRAWCRSRDTLKRWCRTTRSEPILQLESAVSSDYSITRDVFGKSWSRWTLWKEAQAGRRFEFCFIVL